MDAAMPDKEIKSAAIKTREMLNITGRVIMTYVCDDTQDIFRKITPSHKIVAHGRIHWKNAILEFLRFDILAHFRIGQQFPGD